MAERKGFEPLIQYYPYTFLAGRCLQPLGHLSTYFSRERQGRGELVFVNGKSGAGFSAISIALLCHPRESGDSGDLIIYAECAFLDPRLHEDDGRNIGDKITRQKNLHCQLFLAKIENWENQYLVELSGLPH